jgi:protein SCO1
MTAPSSLPCAQRRRWLALAAGACLPQALRAHDMLGPLEPPRAAPALPLTLHDGRTTHLPELLRGQVTALQLMFTGCSATCPVQGAVFAALQPLVLGALPQSQLLSISIDPLSDDAAALAAWRARFGAQPRWRAAVPPVRHGEVMLDFVGGRAQGADRHTAQVYLFDMQGRLAYRMAEFAAAAEIAKAMRALAARG